MAKTADNSPLRRILCIDGKISIDYNIHSKRKALAGSFLPEVLKKQLRAFYYSLISHGMKKEHCPKDWLEAFFMLEMYLQSRDDGARQIVFLDELPWMDTPKSGFITAFESFWNSWACHRNVMVIISGSANSWIQDKLINNHGGLYGRVTYEIKLEPFTLRECELLFRERGIGLSIWSFPGRITLLICVR